MIVLGLTGSIGMGKSTTADMFRALDVPVYDADRTVHELYAGALAQAVEEAFPGVVIDGKVDRAQLSARVIGDSAAMEKLEAIVHPALRREEEAFLAGCRARGEPLVVLDIPLLFETGGERRVDKVAVVTAPADVQRSRVLARSGMSEEKFRDILARQTPDAEKRARADFIVDTSHGLDAARESVASIVRSLRAF
ncbi:MAG: dephospho-CoA kinase [Rhizobiales bacterium]|nr:dephospho-CoA kinase [Hyphomicrobiales bacterium]